MPFHKAIIKFLNMLLELRTKLCQVSYVYPIDYNQGKSDDYRMQTEKRGELWKLIAAVYNWKIGYSYSSISCVMFAAAWKQTPCHDTWCFSLLPATLNCLIRWLTVSWCALDFENSLYGYFISLGKYVHFSSLYPQSAITFSSGKSIHFNLKRNIFKSEYATHGYSARSQIIEPVVVDAAILCLT